MGPRVRETEGRPLTSGQMDGKSQSSPLEVRRLGEAGVCKNIWRAVWLRHSLKDTLRAPSPAWKETLPGWWDGPQTSPRSTGLCPVATQPANFLITSLLGPSSSHLRGLSSHHRHLCLFWFGFGPLLHRHPRGVARLPDQYPAPPAASALPPWPGGLG